MSYRPATTGNDWTLATIRSIGNMGASPIFQLRLADGTVKDAVTTGHMRARMQGQPNLVDADPASHSSATAGTRCDAVSSPLQVGLPRATVSFGARRCKLGCRHKVPSPCRCMWTCAGYYLSLIHI